MYCSIIPSHDVAGLLLGLIRDFLGLFGLGKSPLLEQIIYVAVIFAIALCLGWLVRLAITAAMRKLIAVRATRFARALLDQKIISRCSHIIPPLVILALLPFAFTSGSETLSIFQRLVFAYLIVAFGVGVTSIIGFIFSRYDDTVNKENHPLKGVVAVVKGLVWIVLIIIAVAVLVNKSPMALLGGLGAFAAVLMLVFKDPILGFVASIQLSSNDMLRVGDWIVVPSTQANGTVADVSLTVVKVQNWDNTMIMIPAYSLVSNSFQNWRGMSDSGVRQIDRSLLLDSTTIVPATEELIEKVTAKYPWLKDYVDNRRKMAAEGKPMVFNGGIAPVNGTIDTNSGLFRAHLCNYLLTHPGIAHDQNIIVRFNDATENGTPLDIYCFTSTTDWLAYEAIRTQVMEYVISTAPEFGLRIFNATFHGEISLTGPSAKPLQTAAPEPAPAAQEKAPETK